MKNFNYYGIFLDNTTRDNLIEHILKPYKDIIGNNPLYLDHSTVVHHIHLKTSIGKEIYGICHNSLKKTYKIIINSIGISDKAMAFGVTMDIPCINKCPHITITTFNGGKPKDSNDIVEWKPIAPITIFGELRRIDFR